MATTTRICAWSRTGTTYSWGLGRDVFQGLLIVLVAVLSAGVATASDDAQPGEVDREALTLGPNDVPNFRSSGFLSSPLVEPGLDFSRVGLASAGGPAFPNGRQFVFVRAFFPGPPGGVDRAVQELALDRYRHVLADGADQFHVVLTKENPDPLTLERNETDFSVEELWGAPDAQRLDGPWTVWVDDNNVLTRLTYTYLDFGETATAAQTQPHYVCVEDGRALGSVGGYWPRVDDARLRDLFDACLDGSWGNDWSPIQYRSRSVVPSFRLVDASGDELLSDELSGAPYAIVALAPASQPPIEFTPGRDSPILRAIEPEPADRLGQLRSLFAEAVPDMRIIVLAMPYHDGEELWSAEEVAAALSGQLEAPVYRDASGRLVNALAQYLGQPTSLVVVDAEGRLVDAFSDWMVGEATLAWLQPPSMEDVLRRSIGWGSE